VAACTRSFRLGRLVHYQKISPRCPKCAAHREDGYDPSRHRPNLARNQAGSAPPRGCCASPTVPAFGQHGSRQHQPRDHVARCTGSAAICGGAHCIRTLRRIGTSVTMESFWRHSVLSRWPPVNRPTVNSAGTIRLSGGAAAHSEHLVRSSRTRAGAAGSIDVGRFVRRSRLVPLRARSPGVDHVPSARARRNWALPPRCRNAHIEFHHGACTRAGVSPSRSRPFMSPNSWRCWRDRQFGTEAMHP